ncbi:MAG: hypothetical protein AUI14_08965 [Actinobacteria bacterium 13_2_20CM_2_71_6]|nr:MAG: hypothetical protein AUI14_08965 [Actinobacteria bacterium 13_2_20CM_2_71_6]
MSGRRRFGGGEYCPASDRYAFGGVVYYVLTGTHPPEEKAALRSGLTQAARRLDAPVDVDKLVDIFADGDVPVGSAGTARG